MKDTFRHKGMRRKLVEQLSAKGIHDQKILSVINTIPRHIFLEKAFEEWAYEDKAFPIGNEQTISQPYTVAYQTMLLNIQKRDKVLEIGTGSGYQSAVLAMMGARVFSIERQKNLFDKTSQFLQLHTFGNIRTFYKDGFLGLPEYAPFDKIIITAGAASFPDKLADQLKIGGTMVIPLGDQRQVMHRFKRVSETEFEKEVFEYFQFVPMLAGVNP
jgi:protein-L-isoaspartate(D-aspartate) O-methyltransferase